MEQNTEEIKSFKKLLLIIIINEVYAMICYKPKMHCLIM